MDRPWLTLSVGDASKTSLASIVDSSAAGASTGFSASFVVAAPPACSSVVGSCVSGCCAPPARVRLQLAPSAQHPSPVMHSPSRLLPIRAPPASFLPRLAGHRLHHLLLSALLLSLVARPQRLLLHLTPPPDRLFSLSRFHLFDLFFRTRLFLHRLMSFVSGFSELLLLPHLAQRPWKL